MNLTTSFAVYGAILSTIAVGWNIYNSLQDRPKIIITAKFGFLDFGRKLSETQLIIKAINKGKRSVYLSSMGLRSGEDDLVNLHTTGLPYELKAGGSHSEWFEAEKLKGRKFNFAWYKDATGRMYKSKSIEKKLENYFKSKKESLK